MEIDYAIFITVILMVLIVVYFGYIVNYCSEKKDIHCNDILININMESKNFTKIGIVKDMIHESEDNFITIIYSDGEIEKINKKNIKKFFKKIQTY